MHSLFPIVAIASSAAAHLAPLLAPSNSQNVVPNRFIVKLKPEASSEAFRSLVTRRSGGKDLNMVALPVINALTLSLPSRAIHALRNETDVEYVEPVQIYTTRYSWGIDRINQRNKQLDRNVQGSSSGANVDVYVLDTGIDVTHPQFEGRAKVFWSAFSNQRGDGNGHGTHCAGTIGSADYGVAPKVNLFAVKVLSDGGSGTNEGIIQGINYILQYRRRDRPAVASMSLGGGYSQALNDAIDSLVRNGITTTVAAGNENQDACNVSPASAPLAITVGSTTVDDIKSSFSNWGRCVDILAPGTQITSTWPGNTINTISGTSMATPHVAGTAAVYLSTYPQATPQQVTNALLQFSSANIISGFGSSTPNRFLYDVFISAPTTTITTPAPTSTGRRCIKTCELVPDKLCDIPEVCNNFPTLCKLV